MPQRLRARSFHAKARRVAGATRSQTVRQRRRAALAGDLAGAIGLVEAVAQFDKHHNVDKITRQCTDRPDFNRSGSL
jgi:hypothetical protein